MESETFWRKVDIGKINECWLWKAGRTGGGRGCFRANGKPRLAHRVAFELFHGRKPTKWILHRCDNGLCVNPLHLYEGTGKDNARDRAIRGISRTIELRQRLWKCDRGGRGRYAGLRKIHRLVKARAFSEAAEAVEETNARSNY